MSFNLTGAGGGGGSSYRNRPDNLRSTDTFEALIGISSGGPIRGLAPGGLKNLFIDDVPFEDAQGNANFSDFVATVWTGDPTQLKPAQLRLGASSGANNVGLDLSNPYGNVPGEWRNSIVTQTNLDFIDLRFLVQQLYYQTKSGINDATASIEIQLRPSGSSTWINPLLDVTAAAYNENGFVTHDGGIMYALREDYSDNGLFWNDSAPGYLRITGKTTSTYVKELRLGVPKTGTYANKTWEIRCRLIEIDYEVSGTDGENEVRRTINWESVAGASTQEIGNAEGWRGVAYLQLYGKATDQINAVPEITGVWDLSLHKVPPLSVWNPETRVYSGAAWDGVTTQVAWTQCPAWQLKGLIEDDLSGVAALVPGSTLNKWDVLETSKWFSQLVPDGKGGTHPRYSANWYLDKPMQVHELVNYLAGAVGSFAWDGGDGQWRLKAERPENPVDIFTTENIIGEFVYSHTDADSRYNDFTGVFRNEENRYEEDRIRVYDQPDIDANGRRHTTVALMGCTNRQEALRRLKIRLLTTLNEKRIVTFTTNRRGSLLRPFSVIAVADGDLNNSSAMRSTGRIVEMNPARTQITVRDSLRLEMGVSYQLTLTTPNPDYNPEPVSQPTSEDWTKPTVTLTRNITNSNGQRGDVYTLYLDSALPSNTPDLAVVALSAVGLPALPKQYRVTNLQTGEDNEQVVVSAIEIYTPKWVESDNVDEGVILSQRKNLTVPPPTNVTLATKAYTSNQGTRTVLSVNWHRPNSSLVTNYKVTYSHNGAPDQVLVDGSNYTTAEIVSPREGVYNFKVYAIDRRGVLSLPVEQSITITQDTLTGDDLRDVVNEVVPLGTNTVINSEFRAGLTGFSPGWDGNTGLTVYRQITTDTNWTGVVQTANARVYGAPMASTGFDGYTNLGDASLAFDERLQRWALPAVPGDRLYFSILLGVHRCHGYTVCTFVDEDGNYVGEIGGNLVTNATKDFYLGDPNNAEASGAFAVVPTTLSASNKPARYAVLSPRAIMTGDTAPVIFFGRYFLAKVAAGQAVPPIYGPGPGDPRADVTAESAIIIAITSDSIFDRTEKRERVITYDALYDNWQVLDAKGTALSIAATERAAATTAMNALWTYLSGLSPAWNDVATDTPIVAATFMAKWSDANAAVAALQAAIQGAPGDDGAPGISTSLTVASVQVNTNPGGALKAGEAARIAGKFVLNVGGVATTSGVTFSIPAQTPIPGLSIDSAGNYGSATSVVSFPAQVTVRAVYAGTAYDLPFTVTEARDAIPASGQTAAITALGTAASFVDGGTFDVLVPNGLTLYVSANIVYEAAASPGDLYAPRIKITYQNLTDGGAETDFTGSLVDGSDADVATAAYGDTFGSYTNSLGASKLFRVKFKSRRSGATSGLPDNVSGTLYGELA